MNTEQSCKPHKWDKEKGKREPGKPLLGIRSRFVRTCTLCGYKEYWTNDGMFCGWFSVPLILFAILLFQGCITPYDTFYDCEEVYQAQQGGIYEINDTIR